MSAKLRDVVCDHVISVCESHAWNMLQAAKALGIDRRTLYRHLERRRIDPRRRRAAAVLRGAA